MGLTGLVSRIFGSDLQSQPRGYYETQKQQWQGQIPREVERILPDREGCERVTKLTGRSMLGVWSVWLCHRNFYPILFFYSVDPVWCRGHNCRLLGIFCNCLLQTKWEIPARSCSSSQVLSVETLLEASYQFGTAFFIETFVRVFNVELRNVTINGNHLPELRAILNISNCTEGPGGVISPDIELH